MTMIHTVIACGPNKEVLQVICCFSERQIPIAKREIEKQFPGSKITVKSQQDHPEPPDTIRK